MTMSNNNNNNGHNRDTTLTKVFVGGLAWETPKEAMHEHFEKYGEILEAVIISDKITGRSKGYGFVTFKDPEAAKKACEDATPIINGRRANCNLAALGARRPPRSSSTSPPLQQHHGGSNGSNTMMRGPNSPATAPPAGAGQVQWYYPAAAHAAGPPAATAAIHAHQPHQAIPLYGYSPAYIAGHDHVGYNHKVSYNTGGAYMNGHYTTQMYPGQAMIAGGNTMMPMYPFYPYAQHHHHNQHPHHAAAMGLPAQIFTPTSSIATSPPIISKPSTPVCIAPPTGTVGAKGNLKKISRLSKGNPFNNYKPRRDILRTILLTSLGWLFFPTPI